MRGDFNMGGWLVQPSRDVIESPDQQVQLEPKAMDLLVYLAQHQGEVLSKERIIQAVWPDTFVTDEALTNSIWKLRQALGDDPKNPRFIQTVPRRGYQLIIEVDYLREAEEAPPRYRVQGRLGEGGMGEVYLAEDTFLHRRVALKFLQKEMEADGHWRRRLIREARAAAALDHPFICKVYDVGEIDGRTFIALEYVEGETLKKRLEKGPMAMDEVVEIAGEMVEALEIAHQEGIVHRDIKPSNIVLTRQGHVKVTDFGLARRIQPLPGKEQEWTDTLTNEASTQGTLPYMSPEQIRGQPLDSSSDLFSLGIVLYEMLTGKHPFRKDLSADTAAAILTQEPLPLSMSGNHFPEPLQKALDRSLAKDPNNRYRSVSELREDLRSAATPLSRLEPAKRPQWSKHYIAGALLALVAVAAAVGLGWWRSLGTGAVPEGMPSIAVLPLDNLLGDAERDYLVDGSTEILTMELGKIGSLRVISRKTMERYKGSGKALALIAREITAAGGPSLDALAYGSVANSGSDTIRVNLALMRVEPEAMLWNHFYEGKLNELPVLYRQMAEELAKQMGASPAQSQLQRARKEITAEAYDSYLRGLWGEYSKESVVRRIGYLQDAIKLEPTFAPAYVGLASAYGAADFWFPAEEVYPKAKQAALLALEIDDTVVGARRVLASVNLWYDWQWAAAEELYKRELELNPSSGHLAYSRCLVAMGRFEEAISECKQAIQLDPLSDQKRVQLGWTYIYARRYDESIRELQKLLELRPDYELARIHLSWSYTLAGRYAEAVAELERANVADESMSAPWVYAKAGQRDKAVSLLDGILKLGAEEHLDLVGVAVDFFALDDWDSGFEYLEKAYGQRSPYLVLLNVDPFFDDTLRQDPRYADLLRRIGF